MTTRAYVHSPVPPFPRVGGPIAVNSIQRRTGLSVDSYANLVVAAADIDLDWMRAGMCWSIDQSDIGERLWAGFVGMENYPMDSEGVEIPLVGPKVGLLSVEMAVKLPVPVSSGYAVFRAVEAAQTRNGGIFPGNIEQTGPAIILDVRGETVSDFINTVGDTVRTDWHERIIQKENELEFLLDFGLIQNETGIVLGRNEIVTGDFQRSRVVASLTELSQAVGFAQRVATTVAGGARQAAGEPGDGTLHPQNEKVAELLRERDIGPASTRHMIEISERVSPAGVANLAMERHEAILLGVEEIVFTLDATTPDGQAVQVGDVVHIYIPQWFKTMDVNTDVHVREIKPNDATGQRDVVASVML